MLDASLVQADSKCNKVSTIRSLFGEFKLNFPFFFKDCSDGSKCGGKDSVRWNQQLRTR
jgi:hypothetical protein